MTAEGFIRFVLVANVVAVLAVLPLAWLLGGTPAMVGAAAGGALGIANFAAVAWLLGRLLKGPAARAKPAYGLLLGGKFLVLAALIFFMVRVLGLDSVGVALGYSSMVLALLAGGFRYAVTPEPPGDGDGDVGS